MLSVDVRDAQGARLQDNKVKLGGGARRHIPSWADPTKALRMAPALDDEGVPY